MTRFVSIVIALFGIFFIWLLIVTWQGCAINNEVLKNQGVSYKEDTTSEELVNKVNSLQNQLNEANKKLQDLQDNVTVVVPTPEPTATSVTDVNITLRGDWTAEDRQQLKEILRDALNNQ